MYKQIDNSDLRADWNQMICLAKKSIWQGQTPMMTLKQLLRFLWNNNYIVAA